ncbi:MAG: SGNH/GDSL hydrolase family protein [Rhodospirillaceae bacterium]|nr:SGNH/GDSL hydrolase family protein [Rhodospirillaceae bacterium]MBT5458417.1 SGNH/GDSL hydrolase family protein [Rhodospirillaceae bacterium]
MKIITVNLGVTLLLLIGINVIAALLYDAKTLLKPGFNPAEQISQKIDQQYALAPYKDKKAGYQILSEVENMGTDYKSFVGWSRKPYRGKTTTVDEAGDRQHSGESSTPTGTVRLFGGSAMWGRGAADQGTIPALLNRAFPDYQVFNHGEAGFTSRQALARLINIANQAEDLGTVVFYDGVNDIYTHCWTKGGINTHARERYIRGRLDGDVENETLLQKLENTSLGPVFLTETYKLLLSAKEYLAPSKGPVKQTIKSRSRCQNDPRYARRVAMTLIENWKLAKSIVEARGGRFIAVLQPVIYMGRPVTEHVKKPKDLPRLEGDYKSIYPIIQSELRKMSASWVADFTDVFDVDEPLYIDFCHVTEIGNTFVVKRLAALMRNSVNISLNGVPISAPTQN